MKKYIVIQMQIDGNTIKDGVIYTNMSNVVRQIDAETREEAIGKFVVGTSQIKALKKFNIDCFELNDLIEIK